MTEEIIVVVGIVLVTLLYILGIQIVVGLQDYLTIKRIKRETKNEKRNFS